MKKAGLKPAQEGSFVLYVLRDQDGKPSPIVSLTLTVIFEYPATVSFIRLLQHARCVLSIPPLLQLPVVAGLPVPRPFWFPSRRYHILRVKDNPRHRIEPMLPRWLDSPPLLHLGADGCLTLTQG